MTIQKYERRLSKSPNRKTGSILIKSKKRKNRSILTKSKKRSRSSKRKSTKKIRNVLLRGGECSEISDTITAEDFASMDPFNKLVISSGRDGIEYCYDFDSLASYFVNYDRRHINWYTQTPFTFVQLQEMRKFVDMKMNIFRTDEEYQKLRLYEDFDNILKGLEESTVEGQALAEIRANNERVAEEQAFEIYRAEVARRQVADENERKRQAALELLVKQYFRKIISFLLASGRFVFNLPINMLNFSFFAYAIAYAIYLVPRSVGEDPVFEKIREIVRDSPLVQEPICEVFNKYFRNIIGDNTC
jgi:hypothetical protein